MKQGLYIQSIILFTLTLFSWTLTGQCNINNFTVITSNCIDENTIEVTVDFDTDTPSPIGYQLVTTVDFVIVQYNEFPYTLTLDPNCVTDYSIGVVDLSVADCEVNQNLGVLCCDFECEIEVDVIDLQCTDNLSILANLDVDLIGSFEDSLDIYTNNTFTSTVALTNISAILLPSSDPVLELIVCEQGNTTCCDTLDLVDPCFCNIFDISAAVLDCDPFMNSYFLRIDFETNAPSSDSFNIGRPGNALGRHAYADLPVRVGPIDFDDNDDDIFILDQFDAFCFGFIPHITLDSCDAISCEFSNLEVQAAVDCDNSGDATLSVSFNTTVESQGFFIQVNDENFGPFDYGENDYSLGPISSENVSQFDVEVIDMIDESCNISTTVIPVSCDCSFDNLNTIQFCNQDSLIAILIDFDPKDAVSDSFDLVSSISSTRYAYSQLPINVTGLPTEDISLEIIDANNNNCTLLIEEPIECILECSITNFEVELLSCESLGVANLSFTFNYQDLTTDTIILSYNGVPLGNYLVQDSGEYIIPFLEIDCEIDFNSFALAPINDPDCGSEFAMPNIDCCTPCEITDLLIFSECNSNDMIDEILLDFDYNGEIFDTFTIIFNNQPFGPFQYLDFIPTSLEFEEIPSGEYPLEINFPTCSLLDTFSINCFEGCFIDNIQMDTLSCNEGMFTALLNFDYDSTNDSFYILINDFPYDTFELSQLPLEIGPFMGNGFTQYDFSFFILNEDDCSGDFNFGVIECDPNAIDENILQNIKWSTLPNGTLIEGISSFNEWILFDINGRKIEQNKISENQFFIDNTDRITGLYFIRLIDQEGNIHSIKIIL